MKLSTFLFVFLAFCINFILKFLFFQLYWLVCHFLIDFGQVLCVCIYICIQYQSFMYCKYVPSVCGFFLFSLKGIFL